MDASDEQLINHLLKEKSMEENGHIFQWSKFSPDRSEQYVIRHNDETEFDRLVLKYKSVIPQEKAFPDDTGRLATPQSNVQAGVPICKVHNKPMREGKYGWFCATKVGDGWCKEKPPVEYAR